MREGDFVSVAHCKSLTTFTLFTFLFEIALAQETY